MSNPMEETPALFDISQFTKQTPPALDAKVVAAHIPAPAPMKPYATPIVPYKPITAPSVAKRMAAEIADAMLAPGRAARDKAIQKVETHANDEWKQSAFAAVEKTAREAEAFIVDSVWLRMPEGSSTHEGRAMGAIMQKAQREGLIAPTNDFRPSFDKTHHACPRRVWKSLVYGGGV